MKLDPPALNPWVRVLVETEKGRYPELSLRSGRLPALLAASLLASPQSPEVAEQILSELSRLEFERVSSFLIPYLRGLQAERGSDKAIALAAYEAALSAFPSAYPAQLGRARIFLAGGKRQAAISLLNELRQGYPDNRAIQRLLALALYQEGDYSAASPLIQAVLRAEPTNESFIIMRAHILILSGAYLQAGPLLDAYATRNPHDPLYLYLRSLHLWKEQKRRVETLETLNRAMALYPDDMRFIRLKAEFLLESDNPSPQDKQSARLLLESALALNPKDAATLRLLAKDALAAGEYQRSLSFLDNLLSVDPSFKDYALMTDIAFKAKQARRAATWADTWYAQAPQDDSAAATKARALIETGQSQQALALINERLAKLPSAKFGSVLYYLRSRLQREPELALNDLRASLMDDPRNLDAILAMFDSHFAVKDYKKAQYYLRQAQAVSPASAEVATRARNLGSLAGQ